VQKTDQAEVKTFIDTTLPLVLMVFLCPCHQTVSTKTFLQNAYISHASDFCDFSRIAKLNTHGFLVLFKHVVVGGCWQSWHDVEGEVMC